MRHKTFTLFATALCLTIVLGAQQKKGADLGFTDTPILPGQKWHVHDPDRPHPRVVTPGKEPGAAPSDAIVLFDGKDFSKWEGERGGEEFEIAESLHRSMVSAFVPAFRAGRDGRSSFPRDK